MAKRKRIGKSNYTSQGLRRSSKGCRSLTPMQRLLNQQEAWMKGKRVMLVIDSAGNKAEAQAVWGLPPMLRKKESNA
jgi:hypothetical protein|tara:strand:- start:1636 stop:1866 length:231 start_codon:yes stop_codon:yes gene_type:complete